MPLVTSDLFEEVLIGERILVPSLADATNFDLRLFERSTPKKSACERAATNPT